MPVENAPEADLASLLHTAWKNGQTGDINAIPGAKEKLQELTNQNPNFAKRISANWDHRPAALFTYGG